MELNIFELLFTVIEAFIKVFFFTHYFDYKKKNGLHYVVFGGGVIVETVLVTVLNNYALFEGITGAAVYVLFSMIFCCAFLKGKFLEKLLVCCLTEVFLALVSLSTISILGIIANKSFIEIIMQQEIWRWITLVFTKCMFIFAVMIVLHLRHKDNIQLSGYEWAIIVSIFVCSLVLVLCLFDIMFNIEFTPNTNLMVALIIAGLIAINVLAATITIRMSRSNAKKAMTDLLSLQVEQQEKNIDDINRKYTEIIKLRHDYKNCILCVSGMIENKNYNDAKKYLQEISNEVTATKVSYVNTSSSVLNAVVNSKINYCEEKKIKTSCKITTDITAYPELDISRLLTNLLDNAIEATQKSDNPFLSINIYSAKGFVCIDVKNTVKESVIKNNPLMVTTKSNKSRHGIGLMNIKDIVKNLGGIIDFYEEDGMFVSGVMLKEVEQNVMVH